MEEHEIITDIEKLTPEWLTNIFKSNGYLNKEELQQLLVEIHLMHFLLI